MASCAFDEVAAVREVPVEVPLVPVLVVPRLPAVRRPVVAGRDVPLVLRVLPLLREDPALRVVPPLLRELREVLDPVREPRAVPEPDPLDVRDDPVLLDVVLVPDVPVLCRVLLEREPPEREPDPEEPDPRPRALPPDVRRPEPDFAPELVALVMCASPLTTQEMSTVSGAEQAMNRTNSKSPRRSQVGGPGFTAGGSLRPGRGSHTSRQADR